MPPTVRQLDFARPRPSAAGKVEHGGNPITAGTRYVIVLFMGYSANRSGREAGYVLKQLERLAGGAKDEL